MRTQMNVKQMVDPIEAAVVLALLTLPNVLMRRNFYEFQSCMYDDYVYIFFGCIQLLFGLDFGISFT